MKDVPTTNGMTLDPVIPTSNATVVNKLLDAGAIILGKVRKLQKSYPKKSPASERPSTRHHWHKLST